MVAFTRLNYSRLTHSLRSVTQYLPFTTQKLKPLIAFAILGVLLFQLFLLSTSSSNGFDTGKVLVVDKNSQVSTHYKYLLKKHSENFPSFPLKKKCGLYFKELYNIDNDWELTNPQEDTNKAYDKGTFDKDQFIKDRVNSYKKENNNQEPSDGKRAEFELEYQKSLSSTLVAEQSMIDAVTHLRVFGSCYLNGHTSSTTSFISSWFGNSDEELDGLSEGGSLELCANIEQRLFPWLSRELPQFVRWNGDRVLGIPKMSTYLNQLQYDDSDILLPSEVQEQNGETTQNDETTQKESTKFAKRGFSGSCFMNEWRSALNGKGIVLSVADKYESDLIGLLRVLRALNNRLPIQLVHKGDLAEDVQKRIIEVARSDDVKVPAFLYDKIKNDIPHNFPKQEVWFVNAKRSIRPEFRGSFNGFANKLIAYLFNSFDDMILMDTDSIPLVKPKTLFESGPYQRTNTIFYKDRFNAEKVREHDADYFFKLMPTTVDESLFDIPRSKDVTLNNRYIKNQFRHVMEAGMVGIKRSNHFIGILTSIQLNFWTAAGSRIWGDKELFWLGQSISGNENYEFNKYDVVAVGELTPMADRPRNTIAHELCSTHPGHLSGDDDETLVWINSGMRFCKVDNTWDEDVKSDRFKNYFKDGDELSEFYKAPVRINAVLIPPGGDRFVPNHNNEPAKGWVMNPQCKGYLWCSYDIVGGSTDPLDRGSYIEYDNITEYRNEYYGKLWLNQDLLDLSTYEKDLVKVIEKEEAAKKEKAEQEAKAAKEAKEKKIKEEAEKKAKEEAEKKAKEEAEKKAKEEEAKKKAALEELARKEKEEAEAKALKSKEESEAKASEETEGEEEEEDEEEAARLKKEEDEEKEPLV